MQVCPFCKDPVPAYDKPSNAHLIIAKSKEGIIHTHGNLDNKVVMQELLETAGADVGVVSKIAGEAPKEIIFHNRMRIGDMLMFTCGVRDFKLAFPKTRVNVISTAKNIFAHNPYLDRTLEPFYKDGLDLAKITAKDFLDGKTNVLKVGPGRLTNASNRLDWHFANAFRISIEDSLKLQIPQGESRPDIWLTEEEFHVERTIKDPYWIICVSGEKGWGCKMYPFNKWQEVVNQNPDLTFVQIGTKGDNPPRLQGLNVIDHVGKTDDKHTGIRDLYKLFLNAEGSIGLVSFHMHLSGALQKPCVVIAGGREPVSFTRYPGHAYLSTDGTMPCAVTACWHCDINRCTNLVIREETVEKKIPKCVDIIPSEEVTAAIRRYYTGGRLTLGVPSKKPKFKNIVKTPVLLPEPVKKGAAATPPLDGMNWGKGAIDPLDWPFIEEVMAKGKVASVLEFGAGISTALFIKKEILLASFESEREWIQKVKEKTGVEPFYWNGRDFPKDYTLDNFDMAFVDGPANGQNRETAVREAANRAKIVILHDATRPHEAKWEAKYLKPGFQGPIKGGKWCHLWIKTPSFVKFPEPPPVAENPEKKKIKIVSTARGWGGCGRSITTIMKMLVKAGHDVEFIPFRNKVGSAEFKDCLKNSLMDVQVSESYDSIREACDVLLVYADDFVWEFPTQEMVDAFSGVQATRKVMAVNYRRGKIGEVEWTKGWDKYLFLNSAQEKDFLRVHPGAETEILSPCTDLDAFFEVKPNYDGPLRIVRHNSQGDRKFAENDDVSKGKASDLILKALASRKDIEIHMMPGPSFVPANPPGFVKYLKNQPPIPNFLGLGNIFWYSLPEGYMDMGPRVILEAMAAGLAVIADNWGGAPDRVTPETGWICNSKEEMLEVIRTVTLEEVKRKGEVARKRAFEVFRAERWVQELTGELCTARIS